MKLPDDYPFAKMPLQQFLETEMHRFDCCLAGGAAYFIGTEDPLCRSQQTEPEAFDSDFRCGLRRQPVDRVGGSGSDEDDGVRGQA